MQLCDVDIVICHVLRRASYSVSIPTWWRRQMETFSALLALCAGNSPVTGEFLAQRPVTRSFDVFFDLRLNKRLNKQSWGWWYDRPLRSLWRHFNALKFAPKDLPVIDKKSALIQMMAWHRTGKQLYKPKMDYFTGAYMLHSVSMSEALYNHENILLKYSTQYVRAHNSHFALVCYVLITVHVYFCPYLSGLLFCNWGKRTIRLAFFDRNGSVIDGFPSHWCVNRIRRALTCCILCFSLTNTPPQNPMGSCSWVPASWRIPSRTSTSFPSAIKVSNISIKVSNMSINISYMSRSVWHLILVSCGDADCRINVWLCHQSLLWLAIIANMMNQIVLVIHYTQGLFTLT